MFSMGLSVRYACVLNKYSIVLTIARFIGSFQLYSTFDKKQSLIFQIMSILFQEIQIINVVFDAVCCGTTDIRNHL